MDHPALLYITVGAVPALAIRVVNMVMTRCASRDAGCLAVLNDEGTHSLAHAHRRSKWSHVCASGHGPWLGA